MTQSKWVLLAWFLMAFVVLLVWALTCAILVLASI